MSLPSAARSSANHSSMVSLSYSTVRVLPLSLWASLTSHMNSISSPSQSNMALSMSSPYEIGVGVLLAGVGYADISDTISCTFIDAVASAPVAPLRFPLSDHAPADLVNTSPLVAFIHASPLFPSGDVGSVVSIQNLNVDAEPITPD